MPQLLRNICRVIDTFEKYAQKDGDCTSLSKAELKQLIQEEFADVIVNPYDPKTIESVMQLLDTDCDGKVDFEEFTVLVFKVARACHMKSQECQDPSEGQSKKGEGSQQKPQERQTPGGNSTCQPTQQPQAPREVSGCRPTAESQKPSQEQKQEPPKAEGKPCQPPKQEQEPTRQWPQEPSVTVPDKSKIEDQTAKRDPAQVPQRTQQDCTQKSQNIQDSSHQRTQKPKGSDQGPTREPQQSEQRAAQQPAPSCQGQGQGPILQREVVPQKPTCQPGHHEEQRPSQRETPRSQRGQQEVTRTKPQGSQETDQTSSFRQVQEPQNSERRPGCQSQVEGKPKIGIPERQLQDSPKTREYPAQKPECQPQGSNQSKICCPEREPQVPQQTGSGRQECGSLTSREQHCQQERRPQNPDQAPTCHPEQVPQQNTSGYQECGSSGEERCRQQRRDPQKLEKPQFSYYECEPLGPEEGPTPQDQGVSQARDSDQSCGPAETAQQSVKASWPASHQKPLQFPSPWSPKQ